MKSNLIKRQDAIDIVSFECGKWKGLSREIAKQINALPSAQPERKKGKWIKNYSLIQCSECKRSSWSLSFEHLVRSFKYCPNCGAKMEGEEHV